MELNCILINIKCYEYISNKQSIDETSLSKIQMATIVTLKTMTKNVTY